MTGGYLTHADSDMTATHTSNSNVKNLLLSGSRQLSSSAHHLSVFNEADNRANENATLINDKESSFIDDSHLIRTDFFNGDIEQPGRLRTCSLTMETSNHNVKDIDSGNSSLVDSSSADSYQEFGRTGRSRTTNSFKCDRNLVSLNNNDYHIGCPRKRHSSVCDSNSGSSGKVSLNASDIAEECSESAGDRSNGVASPKMFACENTLSDAESQPYLFVTSSGSFRSSDADAQYTSDSDLHDSGSLRGYEENDSDGVVSKGSADIFNVDFPKGNTKYKILDHVRQPTSLFTNKNSYFPLRSCVPERAPLLDRYDAIFEKETFILDMFQPESRAMPLRRSASLSNISVRQLDSQCPASSLETSSMCQLPATTYAPSERSLTTSVTLQISTPDVKPFHDINNEHIKRIEPQPISNEGSFIEKPSTKAHQPPATCSQLNRSSHDARETSVSQLHQYSIIETSTSHFKMQQNHPESQVNNNMCSAHRDLCQIPVTLQHHLPSDCQFAPINVQTDSNLSLQLQSAYQDSATALNRPLHLEGATNLTRTHYQDGAVFPNRPPHQEGTTVLIKTHYQEGATVLTRPHNQEGAVIFNKPLHQEGATFLTRPNHQEGATILTRPHCQEGATVPNRPFSEDNTIVLPRPTQPKISSIATDTTNSTSKLPVQNLESVLGHGKPALAGDLKRGLKSVGDTPLQVLVPRVRLAAEEAHLVAVTGMLDTCLINGCPNVNEAHCQLQQNNHRIDDGSLLTNSSQKCVSRPTYGAPHFDFLYSHSQNQTNLTCSSRNSSECSARHLNEERSDRSVAPQFNHQNMYDKYGGHPFSGSNIAHLRPLISEDLLEGSYVARCNDTMVEGSCDANKISAHLNLRSTADINPDSATNKFISFPNYGSQQSQSPLPNDASQVHIQTDYYPYTFSYSTHHEDNHDTQPQQPQAYPVTSSLSIRQTTSTTSNGHDLHSGNNSSSNMIGRSCLGCDVIRNNQKNTAPQEKEAVNHAAPDGSDYRCNMVLRVPKSCFVAGFLNGRPSIHESAQESFRLSESSNLDNQQVDDNEPLQQSSTSNQALFKFLSVQHGHPECISRNLPDYTYLCLVGTLFNPLLGLIAFFCNHYARRYLRMRRPTYANNCYFATIVISTVAIFLTLIGGALLVGHQIILRAEQKELSMKSTLTTDCEKDPGNFGESLKTFYSIDSALFCKLAHNKQIMDAIKLYYLLDEKTKKLHGQDLPGKQVPSTGKSSDGAADLSSTFLDEGFKALNGSDQEFGPVGENDTALVNKIFALDHQFGLDLNRPLPDTATEVVTNSTTDDGSVFVSKSEGNIGN